MKFIEFFVIVAALVGLASLLGTMHYEWGVLSVVGCTEALSYTHSSSVYSRHTCSAASYCRYEIACDSAGYLPWVDDRFVDASGTVAMGLHEYRCKKSLDSGGHTVNVWSVSCPTQAVQYLDILEPAGSYVTGSDVVVNVGTNIPEGTTVFASMDNSPKGAVVVGGLLSYNFGSLTRGRHNFKVSYGNASDSVDVDVLARFSRFVLTGASVQSSRDNIVVGVSIQDDTGLGLTQNQVGFTVTSTSGTPYVDYKSMGEFSVVVKSNYLGDNTISVTAVKSGYLAETRTKTVRLTAEATGIIIEMPSAVDAGKTARIYVSLEDPVSREKMDATYLVMKVRYPDGRTVKEFSMYDFYRSGYTYYIDFTFPSYTADVEQYTIEVTAENTLKGLERNTVSSSIFVSPSGAELPPGETPDCPGLWCTGLQEWHLGIIAVLGVAIALLVFRK